MGIIHLLPENVANQIAAGEVVQRPSSVVKELMENSIDAGATQVELWLSDAGKSCIQVIDNGKGMSKADARMSFERHATSKITKAEDLFSLRTMGFRGEALASIASVAQVELNTRREQDETGTSIHIEGGHITEELPVQCQVGANFKIKNLFFNIPARRRFLKSDSTELNHALHEFERVAMINPQIAFRLYRDDALSLELRPSSFKQRIISLFGQQLDKQLLPVKVDTSIIKVEGFVSTPQAAKSKGARQFFFVNGRYMRHPYFNRAIQTAFERLIPTDKQVSFFLQLSVEPEQIDVNIHPTKTEIKFQDESAIFQILLVAIRDALGKFNVVPSMDFEGFGDMEIPSFRNDTQATQPRPTLNSNYNPFESSAHAPSYQRQTVDGWQSLYKLSDTENNSNPTEVQEQGQEFLLSEEYNSAAQTDDAPYSKTLEGQCFQYANRYIITPVRSGLMVIDFVRAHRRVLYDEFLKSFEQRSALSQTLLFPELLKLSLTEAQQMDSLINELNAAGFDIASLGNGTYSVSAVPSMAAKTDIKSLLQELLNETEGANFNIQELYHRMALTLARSNSMQSGQQLDHSQMSAIIEQLFLCDTPNFGPDGKPILKVLAHTQVVQGL